MSSSSDSDAAPGRALRWYIISRLLSRRAGVRLLCRPTDETLLADRRFEFAPAIGFGIVTVISVCLQASVSALLK
jgi:hypothetical protein